MCGIAGEIRFRARADVAGVERMAGTMAPRGPDGSGELGILELWLQENGI